MPATQSAMDVVLAISYNDRRTVYLYPITHSLDFDVLFFGMRNNSLHLLFQLCDSRFQFLNLLSLLLHSAVLLQKFVKQHRVHLVVAHAVGFSFFIAHHQVSVHLFHLFGHKSELRCACCIDFLLVTVGDWFQRKERFASLFHWLNLLFKPSRGSHGAKFAIGINEYGSAARGRLSKGTADVTAVAYVCSGDVRADADNVIGGDNILASTVA